MKRVIASTLVIVGLIVNLHAQDDATKSKTQSNNNDWEFFELMFFPDAPSSAMTSSVYGFKAGAPISAGSGSVTGIEFAAFSCMTYNVDGIQTAPVFCVAKEVNGLQASPVNLAKDVCGLQFGIVNIAKGESCQLGLINIIKDGWLPFSIVFNISY